MFQDIFFDLDDTLLDFGQAERVALQKTFVDVGILATPEMLQRYSQINASLWEQLERGEIKREVLLVQRFDMLLAEYRIDLPGALCEERYRRYLGVGHYFVEGAEDILDYLSPKYRLHLASNGVADTQYSRLESAGIGHYFQNIFISETVGHHKPERAYFDACFQRIPGFDVSRALMIGDSLTSDISGGIQAGMRTCWFNPRQKPGREGIDPDWEIRTLAELKALL